MKRLLVLLVLGGIVGAASYQIVTLPEVRLDLEIPQSAAAIQRGAYLVTAGGCLSCHRGQTDVTAEVMSGGLALETEFGTFYAPNITPDVETGIGGWNAQNFLLALKHGRDPQGAYYYPVFPYRSYAGLSDEDVLDMAAYLMSLEPVVYTAPEPETPIWLRRFAAGAWNLIADIIQEEPEHYDPEREPLLARGEYLARYLGHCGECHTPRNTLGIPDMSREFAGSSLGEEVVEAIDGYALESWTTNNFDVFLLLGLKPDGEFVGGDMNEVIEYTTSKLTEEDRDALAEFFTYPYY